MRAKGYYDEDEDDDESDDGSVEPQKKFDRFPKPAPVQHVDGGEGGEEGADGGGVGSSEEEGEEGDIRRIKRERKNRVEKSQQKFARMSAARPTATVDVVTDVDALKVAMGSLGGGVQIVEEEEEECSDSEETTTERTGTATDDGRPRPPAASVTQSRRQQPARATIFCDECGEPSPEGSAFCSCGEPLLGDTEYATTVAPSPPPTAPGAPSPQRGVNGRRSPSPAREGEGERRGPWRLQSEPPMSSSSDEEEQGKVNEPSPAPVVLPKVGGFPAAPRRRGRGKLPASEVGEAEVVVDGAAAAHGGVEAMGQASGGHLTAKEASPKNVSSNNASPKNLGVGEASPKKVVTGESRPKVSKAMQASPKKPKAQEVMWGGVGGHGGMTEEEEEAFKAKALMEADDLLDAFAPPRAPAARLTMTAVRREGGIEQGGGMLDPFLKSLKPSKWNAGEGDDDDDDDGHGEGGGGIFEQGTQSLLKARPAPKIDPRLDPSPSPNFQNRKQQQQQHVQRQQANGQLDSTFASVANSHATAVSAIMDSSVVHALREAKALFDEGILTHEEFTAQKRIILGQPAPVQQQHQYRAPHQQQSSVGHQGAYGVGDDAAGDERLSAADRAAVLRGLVDDDDSDIHGRVGVGVGEVARRKGGFVVDNSKTMAHHVVTDDSEMGGGEVFMMRPPSASTISSVQVDDYPKKQQQREKAAPMVPGTVDWSAADGDDFRPETQASCCPSFGFVGKS